VLNQSLSLSLSLSFSLSLSPLSLLILEAEIKDECGGREGKEKVGKQAKAQRWGGGWAERSGEARSRLKAYNRLPGPWPLRSGNDSRSAGKLERARSAEPWARSAEPGG
jgi:hypothetical protein